MPAATRPLPTIDEHFQWLNLKVTGETVPKFKDAQVIGTPHVLGNGGSNTVYAVQVERPNGFRVDAVFKPLKPAEFGWVAAQTGIPPHDRKSPCATSRPARTRRRWVSTSSPTRRWAS
ncbi:hypothetical protein [Piscinibacter sp.]|uniref:hypothetical protein n=1 Tax=Piscinibacter sp. TaxID=1903157 RepID=UPI002CB2BD59|nr:hypothetical protein [Albitalea sp.]HUG21032.1 hypothetical protein [Albitalea sp.]